MLRASFIEYIGLSMSYRMHPGCSIVQMCKGLYYNAVLTSVERLLNPASGTAHLKQPTVAPRSDSLYNACLHALLTHMFFLGGFIVENYVHFALAYPDCIKFVLKNNIWNLEIYIGR